MCARRKEQSNGISILDAVDALADFADLEFERDITQAKEDEINAHNREVVTRVARLLNLEDEDPDTTVEGIKNTFKRVLDYLRKFYDRDFNPMDRERAMEGVKTIMVIVGEAAKKLDRYTTLFKRTRGKCVMELKEYKQLQDFYLTRIARKIDESVLGKWILELTKESMAKRVKKLPTQPKTTTRIFIGLDSVKKDNEYELFFIKKEDGTRFYNPRLIRNIKLVCDFGGRIVGIKDQDPLEDIREWQDVLIQESTKDIVASLGGNLDRYYHDVREFSNRKIVNDTNKALMALLLCSNPKNLMTNIPVKTCAEYFVDFQGFLRKVMDSREYQRWIIYPPKKTNKLAHCILNMVQTICYAFFTRVRGYMELEGTILKLIDLGAEEFQPEEKPVMLWEKLWDDYQGMSKLIRHHPNGPLIKDLQVLEQGGYHAFDPITQFNFPFQLFSIYFKEAKMTNIRVPAPVYQEAIHQAEVIHEFKAYLRSLKRGNFLMINLQDRTSWKEHIRCKVLEEMQHQKEFNQILTVVTLAKNTDFYEQRSPYDEDRQASQFIQHFKEQLKEESCGYYFPDKIKHIIFPAFVNETLESIHRVFFGSMNVLTVSNRRDFIEIFYLFLQLKLIEVLQPESFSLTCKDAIDLGGLASAQLFTFLKSLNGTEVTDKELDHLRLILYTAPLFTRERIPLANRFDRMLSVLKRMEQVREEHGHKMFGAIINEAFSRHFKKHTLQAFVLPPK